MRESATTPGTRAFITSVESVRGIAALYVAVSHTMIYTLFAHYTTPLLVQPTGRETALRFGEGLVHGQTAVTVFFVISGLVIGRSLDRHATPSDQQTYVSFLVRRLFRLYPAHLVAMATIVAIGWLFLTGRPAIDFSAYQPADDVYFTDWLQEQFNPLRLKTAVANVAMIRWSMNLVVWSLYVELCTAPLLPIFHRLARSNSRRVDLAAIASLVAISVLLWGHLWIAYWFAFYVGMTVETRGREWACLVRDRFGGAGFMTAVSYAAMVAPAMLMPNGPLVAVLETAGAFSIISLVVWSSETSMFQFLEHPLARWTGRVSYSFYLWHFFVLTMAMRILYALLPAELLYRYDLAVFAATAVLTVALALGVANLSYAFIEIPFIVLGRRVVAGWRGLRPPPAAVSTGTLSGTSD